MHPAIITWCGVGFFAEYPEPAGVTSEGIFLMWAAYFYHLATWGVFLTSCCSPFFQGLISFDMTLPWVLVSFSEPHVSRTISGSAAGSKPSPICLCCGSIWFLVPSTSALLSTLPALTGPVSCAQLLYLQWGHKTVSGPFEQQCPKVLTPGTSFMKHIFFLRGSSEEAGFGMIQHITFIMHLICNGTPLLISQEIPVYRLKVGEPCFGAPLLTLIGKDSLLFPEWRWTALFKGVLATFFFFFGNCSYRALHYRVMWSC